VGKPRVPALSSQFHRPQPSRDCSLILRYSKAPSPPWGRTETRVRAASFGRKLKVYVARRTLGALSGDTVADPVIALLHDRDGKRKERRRLFSSPMLRPQNHKKKPRTIFAGSPLCIRFIWTMVCKQVKLTTAKFDQSCVCGYSNSPAQTVPNRNSVQC
jgi:hypothetical protein